MIYKRLLLVFALTLVLMGCASGSNTPLTPQGNFSPGTIDSIPVIGMTMFEDGSFNALGMLGAYEMTINPQNNTAELVAKRTSAIGESYVVSGIGFFTISPCSSCLKLKSIEIDLEGIIIANFIISHPFKKGDVLKPPSAINRLDLDVFDLALVVYPQDVTPDSYTSTGVFAYPGICVGADGYTNELNEVIEDGSALPYYLVIDDSIDEISTFNKFEMGTEDIEFNAAFDLSAGSLTFDLYVTMGYGWSAMKSDRLTPQYFNPEFNRKSAWKIDVTPPAEPWPCDDNLETCDVVVEVYDWQIGANIDPELANPTDIYAASGVSCVSVEIPGMNSALPTMYIADTGIGTPDDPLVYTFQIANENLLEEGTYYGLVKVTDERAVGTIGERDFIIDAPDGVVLEHFNLPEFAAFQLFTANVTGVSTDACFVIDIHKYFDGIGPDGTTDNPVPTEWFIDFDATCSVNALTFDWDLDGDGTYEVEGLTDPIYTAGYPAGTALGTYYPVLRINGDDAKTFTLVDGITIETGVYVDSTIGTSTGPGDMLNPFDTIVNGVAGVITPAECTLLVRGDDGSGGQLNYQERVNLTSAHAEMHIQGYCLDAANSTPPAMRNYRPPGRNFGYPTEVSECFYGNAASDVWIDGFEFEHIRGPEHSNAAYWTEYVRVIHFEDSDNVRLSHIYFHNMLAENEFQGWKSGYGIYMSNCDDAVISNVIFCDGFCPTDWGYFYGMYFVECDNPTIANATIDQIEWFWAEDWCWMSAYMHGIRLQDTTSAEITNTIVSNLTAAWWDSYVYVERSFGFSGNGNTDPLVDYCNVWNINTGYGHPPSVTYHRSYRFYGDIIEGANCINPGDPLDDFGSDPLYENGHFLQAGSPCIDAGNPDPAYNDTDGTQNDLGCYGGPDGDWNFEN